MPHTDSIGKLLDLKDSNIIFKEDFYSERIIKQIVYKVITAKLTYQPKACYNCGHIFDHQIIKHGFYKSTIKLLSTAGYPTLLDLSKQRYLCNHCDSTFALKTDLVKTNCFIASKTKIAIAIDAQDKISEKDLAKRHNVSHSTVSRIIDTAYEAYKVKRNFLPKNLNFDEFKSVKEASGAMSFLFVNADTGEIVDIVENRKLYYLKNYFLGFTKAARRAVKNIVIDMYAPYMTLIKALFPNANIIIDKFHLVQLYSRALNKTRIRIMNQNQENYSKLKRFWKLLLKDREKLDCVKLRYNHSFKKQMREVDIVEFLLDQSPELKASYKLYQNVKTAIKLKDMKLLESSIDEVDELVSDYLLTSIKTTKKYRDFIENMFISGYTNGVIEGINNKIKVIKRIAFGYRSFVHFKNRILITQGKLKLKTA